MENVTIVPAEVRDKSGRRIPGHQTVTGNVVVPFLQNFVAGFGATLVSHIIMNAMRYRTLDYLLLDTPLRVVSLSFGAVVWGLLCLIRAAWDEVEAITITHAIAKAEAEANQEESAWAGRYKEHIQLAINEIEKLEAENKRLKQQLNAQPKRKRANPVASVTYDPTVPDPYAGAIGVEAFLAGETVASSTSLVDSDTEKDIEAANDLLTHFAQHGTISKSSSEKHSNIHRKQWQRAISFMKLCGVVEEVGGVNKLMPDIEDAHKMIDRYVQSRIKKRESGVHVAHNLRVPGSGVPGSGSEKVGFSVECRVFGVQDPWTLDPGGPAYSNQFFKNTRRKVCQRLRM